MTGYHPGPAPGSLTLRLTAASVHAPRRAAGPATARRFTAWIVRIIMLATSTFAVLDLYLLATSVHH